MSSSRPYAESPAPLDDEDQVEFACEVKLNENYFAETMPLEENDQTLFLPKPFLSPEKRGHFECKSQKNSVDTLGA